MSIYPSYHVVFPNGWCSLGKILPLPCFHRGDNIWRVNCPLLPPPSFPQESEHACASVVHSNMRQTNVIDKIDALESQLTAGAAAGGGAARRCRRLSVRPGEHGAAAVYGGGAAASTRRPSAARADCATHRSPQLSVSGQWDTVLLPPVHQCVCVV